MGEYLKDLAERTVRTFVGAFAAVLTASGTNLLDVSAYQAAAVAGYGAVATLILGFLARAAGSPDDASFRSK